MADDLDLVVHGLLELLADLPHPPDALRVDAGGVRVELEWPVSAPAVPAIPAVPVDPGPVDGVRAADGGGDGAPLPDGTGAATGTGAANGTGTGPNGDGDGEPAGHRHLVRSPTVGTFLAAPAPGGEPLVAVGDRVGAGAQVAAVRVMDLPVPVRVGAGGRVVEVLRQDGDPVEYDQPLLVVDTTPED